MNLDELIERLEKATGPDNKLDFLIRAAVGDYDGYKSPDALTDMWRLTAEYEMPELVKAVLDTFGICMERRPYTSSIDAALTLGRTDDEKREILEAIHCNWNDTYPLARCILWGCAEALKLRRISAAPNT